MRPVTSIAVGVLLAFIVVAFIMVILVMMFVIVIGMSVRIGNVFGARAE